MQTETSTATGVYVHVPFCASVCPYCDFAVTLAGEDRRLGWQEALIEEAVMYRGAFSPADTLYLGGGTPSVLGGRRLRQVLAGLKRELALADDVQLFLEINPEDVDLERARDWAEIGVHFASVGIQSLNDRALDFLGRGHTGSQALQAVAMLQEVGIPTISVDLIFGLPGQAAHDWRQQLATVAELGVDHISCYQLTIHAGTAFDRRRRAGKLEEMPEDQQAGLYLLTHEVLADAGFEGYEVSNFARAGRRSAHNMKYWTGAPYLGLGPSAHSFDGHHRRWWNTRKLRLWQRQVRGGGRPIAGSEDLAPVQSALEAVMLGVRLADGVDLGAVEKKWNVEVDASSWRFVQRYADEGLVVVDDRRVRPTAKGMAVADALARSIDFASVDDGADRDDCSMSSVE